MIDEDQGTSLELFSGDAGFAGRGWRRLDPRMTITVIRRRAEPLGRVPGLPES